MSVAGTALHRLPLSSVQEDSSPPRCNQLPVSLTTQLDDQLSGRSLGPWPATAQRRCNGSDRLPRLRHRQRSVDCTARSTSPLPRNLYWTAAGEVVYCPVFFSSSLFGFLGVFGFSDFFWLPCACTSRRTKRRGGALREQQRAHFDLPLPRRQEQNQNQNEKEGRGSIEPRTQDRTHIRSNSHPNPTLNFAASEPSGGRRGGVGLTIVSS